MKHPEIDRVLVTGGAGTVGKALLPALRQAGYSVRAMEHLRPISPVAGMEVVKGAVHDEEALRDALQDMDGVCHFIRASPDASAEEWIRCCILGTRNLLEAARSSRIRRVILGSGDNIFGVPTSLGASPLRETNARRSNGTAYSLTKILEEELIRQYQLSFGVSVTLTIFPLIWRQDLLSSGIRNVDHQARTIYQILDRSGADFIRHDIHLTDAIQGILRALRSDKSAGDTFLFASPRPHASSELAQLLRSNFGYAIALESREWNSWSIDYSKAVQILGYKPRVDLLEWLAQSYGLPSVAPQ